MRINAWYNGTNYTDADAGAIQLRSTIQASNVIYVDDSVTSWRITSVKALGTYYVGEPMCISGVISHYVCGSIVKTSFPIESGGKNLVDHFVTSFPVYHGDSGAPIFWHRQAVGVVSSVLNYSYRGRSYHFGLVSKIGHVVARLGIPIKTS
jgi:hypothetical protein